MVSYYSFIATTELKVDHRGSLIFVCIRFPTQSKLLLVLTLIPEEDEKIRRRGERSLIGSVLFSYREPAGRELRFQESSRFRSYSAARAYLCNPPS